MARAVSADGAVVVGWGGGFGTGIVALRWVVEGDGLPEALGTLPGGGFSFPFAVSADGSAVVGWADTPDRSDQVFLWRPASQMERLGPGLARGVSADGSVVVGSGPGGAFRWTRLGGFARLGFLPGGGRSDANAVSGDGRTVVGSAQREDGANVASRWVEETGLVGLGLLPGGTGSYATATSQDGSVVIGGGDSTNGQQVFRWTVEDPVIRPLFAGFPRATDASGNVVVGGEELEDFDFEERAVIWEEATQRAQPLSERLGSLVPAGWQLEDAWGLSANGRVVAGTGKNPGLDAWVATLGPRCVAPDPPDGGTAPPDASP